MNDEPIVTTAEEVKPSIYFFSVTEDKQKPILLKCLPLMKPFFDEFRRITKLQAGGEKAKASNAAQAALLSAEALLMNKNDAITRAEGKNRDTDVLYAERDKAQLAAVEARLAAQQAFTDAKTEETELGLETLQTVLTNALEIHYENAIAIAAAFDNKTREALGQEKDAFEIIDMLLEIASHDKVVAVFTKWQGFRAKMRFGTL